MSSILEILVTCISCLVSWVVGIRLAFKDPPRLFHPKLVHDVLITVICNYALAAALTMLLSNWTKLDSETMGWLWTSMGTLNGLSFLAWRVSFDFISGMIRVYLLIIPLILNVLFFLRD